MNKFDVAIIMGSDSDLSIMKDAAKFLEDMDISYEMKILSVHRTPENAFKYAMACGSATAFSEGLAQRDMLEKYL